MRARQERTQFAPEIIVFAGGHLVRIQVEEGFRASTPPGAIHTFDVVLAKIAIGSDDTLGLGVPIDQAICRQIAVFTLVVGPQQVVNEYSLVEELARCQVREPRQGSRLRGERPPVTIPERLLLELKFVDDSLISEENVQLLLSLILQVEWENERPPNGHGLADYREVEAVHFFLGDPEVLPEPKRLEIEARDGVRDAEG